MCRVAIMLRLCLTFRGFFYPNYAYKRLAYKKKNSVFWHSKWLPQAANQNITTLNSKRLLERKI